MKVSTTVQNGFAKIKSQLPTLGVGLGLRSEIRRETFQHSDKIDWLEFTPETYMRTGGSLRHMLDEAAARFPLVSHGVNLSLGSTDELNRTYLSELKELLDTYNAPWFSDHICFASVDEVYIQDLLPLPWTRKAASHIVERIKRVQDFIERPILIENISYYMAMPDAEMDETDFISTILEEADCGLLLDINNVYVNSVNHNFDPIEYLNRIPLDRTVQIHMAGHATFEGKLIDTHGEAVPEPVFKLLEHVTEKTHVNAVMIERDMNFPEFGEILKEVAEIRDVRDRHSKKSKSNHDEKTIEVVTTSIDERNGEKNFKSNKRSEPSTLEELEKAFFFAGMNSNFEKLMNNSSKAKRKKSERLNIPHRLRHALNKFDKRGLHLYSRMFHTAHRENMEQLYPLTSKALEKYWTALMYDHLEKNPPKSYSIRRSGKTFSAYLAGHDWIAVDYPYLIELALFEQLKLDVMTIDATTTIGAQTKIQDVSQLSSTRPILNTALHLKVFEYNVVSIAEEIANESFAHTEVCPQKVSVVIFRHPEYFTPEVSIVSEECAKLIELSTSGDKTYRALLEELMKSERANENLDMRQAVIDFLEMQERLQEIGIFTGSCAVETSQASR